MKKIARERVERLFQLADDTFHEHPARAQRYIQIARRVAMAARERIRPALKRRICHGCKRFLVPGANCRYRLQSRKGQGSRVVVTCLECKHQTRYYIKKRHQRRRRTTNPGAEAGRR